MATRRSAPDDRRNRVLDAMTAACAVKGYRAVTIADIVQRAHVSRGTFYELFPSKESCFLAAVEEALAAILSEARAANEPSKAWADAVAGGIAAVMTALSRQPAYAHIACIEVLAAGPAAHGLLDAAHQRLRALLELGRAELDRPGADLPARTARAILGAGEALIADELAAGRGARLHLLAPDLTYAALVGYVGQLRALRQAGLEPPDPEPAE